MQVEQVEKSMKRRKKNQENKRKASILKSWNLIMKKNCSIFLSTIICTIFEKKSVSTFLAT